MEPSLAKRKNIGSFLDACSHHGVLRRSIRPNLGSAFRAAGKAVGEKQHLNVAEFAEMMQAAVQGIQATGERSFGRGAVVGDKTLIDALVPCADAWTQSAESGDDFKTVFAKVQQQRLKGRENGRYRSTYGTSWYGR